MDPLDRIIGQLQAHHQDTYRRLIAIENKIDALQEFRWRAVGATLAISAICSVVVTGLVELFK